MNSYINIGNLKTINAELTNYCNAACPMCPRFDFDLNLIKDITNNSHTTLEAVKNSAHALDFADDSFKEDKEIMLEVVKRNLALYYARENSQKDPDILAIINKEQTSDKERAKLLEAFEFLVQQIAKGLKEAFDDDEDIALDYAIPSKKNFELVITRDSEGEDGMYNITLDLHEYESDDYEQIAYSGGGSELSDFEGIIQAFIENGGRIEDLYTYIVKEN